MSDSKPVPRIALDQTRLLPAPFRIEWGCLCCPFRASAVSEHALVDALDAHTAYVNTHADRATDPHFAEVRMEALIRG